MTTRVEIGERLRMERRRLGLTQGEVADRVGVSKTTQANYESGFRPPDAEYLSKASAIGFDVLFVVTGRSAASEGSAEADDSYVVIPRFGISAAAGNGFANAVPDGINPVHGLSFSRAWLSGRNLAPASLCVIQVHGASMEKVLSHGDLVLIDRADTSPRSGFVYVIRQGDELLVKYCQLLPGGLLKVSSANPDFAPYEVDLAKTPDVEIIGRVVASMHEW